MTYGWFIAGTGKARWRRMTIRERIGLRRRRKIADDLSMVRT